MFWWVVIFVLSPFYVSIFMYWRWYIDELGIFHANKTSISLDSHLKYGRGWYRQTCLSPPVFFTNRSKAVLLLWIIFVNCVLCVCRTVLSVPCSLLVTYWERADLLALLYVMFSCVFVTFPYGVLGQIWYLIVSIPDLCLLSYFAELQIDNFYFICTTKSPHLYWII